LEISTRLGMSCASTSLGARGGLCRASSSASASDSRRLGERGGGGGARPRPRRRIRGARAEAGAGSEDVYDAMRFTSPSPSPSPGPAPRGASPRKPRRHSRSTKTASIQDSVPWGGTPLPSALVPPNAPAAAAAGAVPAGATTPGLALPGSPLPVLAEQLHTAVEQSFRDVMYDECVVDMSPFGVQECYGDVANALAEVVVAANAAEVAGRFNMALRRKELHRLRAALWQLRLKLESHVAARECCTMTVRHRLEALRSASLDVCHPEMRAPDAPDASAIPNFQAVHQDFNVDADADASDPGPFNEDAGCALQLEAGTYTIPIPNNS